jgi:hypothetical protein
VRRAGSDGIAVLLANVRANEQLGQAIVVCVGYMGAIECLLSSRVGAM